MNRDYKILCVLSVFPNAWCMCITSTSMAFVYVVFTFHMQLWPLPQNYWWCCYKKLRNSIKSQLHVFADIYRELDNSWLTALCLLQCFCTGAILRRWRSAPKQILACWEMRISQLKSAVSHLILNLFSENLFCYKHRKVNMIVVTWWK